MLKKIILHVLVAYVIAQENDDECISPNQEFGECVLLKQCSSLINILKHHPVHQEELNYLKKSHCGFVGFEPKVCCPYFPYNTNTAGKNFESGSSTGEIVSPLLPLDICGNADEGRILGRNITDIGQYPWLALLQYQKPGGIAEFHCGGALINNRYILTAAHCIISKNLPQDWILQSVVLGEHNLANTDDCAYYFKLCADPPLNILIEEKIVHEYYNPNDPNQYHDIALLRLKTPVTFSDYVAPICLLNGKEKSTKYMNMLVAGWGKSINLSIHYTEKVKVLVKVNKKCPMYAQIAHISLGAGQICAGGEKLYDSCIGDSGGPLMALIYIEKNGEPDVNWYLVGVKSFGPPGMCDVAGFPSIYTEVTDYMSWIVGKLKP